MPTNPGCTSQHPPPVPRGLAHLQERDGFAVATEQETVVRLRQAVDEGVRVAQLPAAQLREAPEPVPGAQDSGAEIASRSASGARQDAGR